jgi:predicted acetyltransferase
MDRTLRGMHEEGVPISTLYPATQTLYRRSGYDQAGYRIRCSLTPAAIGVRAKEGSLRKAGEEDRESVKALYASVAPGRPGHLERGPYVWDRVFTFRDQPASGYLVEESGRLTGYVFIVQLPLPDFGYELLLTDLLAVTPVAARRILALLSDHRSLAREIRWFTSPANPVLAQLAEQPFRFDSLMIWTTRMVDVEKSLLARGYTPGLAGEVQLEVRDDLLPANQDRFRLRVEDGRPRVERGGRGGQGGLRIDVRGLTSLFTGFLSATALAGMGLLEGPAEEIRQADALFAGPTPWMPDMF